MLEGSGNKGGARDFESVEKFTGELEPGDEKVGQFITDVTTAETYYMRQDPGSVDAVGTKQVIWTFTAEETK